MLAFQKKERIGLILNLLQRLPWNRNLTKKEVHHELKKQLAALYQTKKIPLFGDYVLQMTHDNSDPIGFCSFSFPQKAMLSTHLKKVVSQNRIIQLSSTNAASQLQKRWSKLPWGATCYIQGHGVPWNISVGRNHPGLSTQLVASSYFKHSLSTLGKKSIKKQSTLLIESCFSSNYAENMLSIVKEHWEDRGKPMMYFPWIITGSPSKRPSLKQAYTDLWHVLVEYHKKTQKKISLWDYYSFGIDFYNGYLPFDVTIIRPKIVLDKKGKKQFIIDKWG